MKKVALVLILALSLGGCAGTKVGDFFNAFTGATVGVANPVTPDKLKAAEDGLTLVFAGLNAYKKSCDARAIPSSCRTVVKAIQAYTVRLPSLLADLRTFVRNNDQVNAITAYNTIMRLISDAKGTAAANNVPMPAA